MANNIEIKDYKNLSENQIFEKAREELKPIKESLSEKKITIDDAKARLREINEWIQETKLAKKDKKEIWTAFEKLVKLEKNIDENAIKNEVDEIINLLWIITKRDLANLKQGIQQNKQWRNPERTPEVQKWIDIASSELETTIHEASQDHNPIARKIGERMENLMA